MYKVKIIIMKLWGPRPERRQCRCATCRRQPVLMRHWLSVDQCWSKHWQSDTAVCYVCVCCCFRALPLLRLTYQKYSHTWIICSRCWHRWSVFVIYFAQKHEIITRNVGV